MSSLKNISLFHFKNYEQQTFLFEKEVVCLIGKNGVGKTSILDAIGKTVSLLEESKQEDNYEKHLLIFSDFEENSSSFYNVEMIGELIAEYRQKKNWEFYAFGLKLSQESLFQKMNFNSKNLIFLDS
jgi:recombinational DNA repair ATPase RecF